MTTPNIFQRINAVRQDFGYIQKDKEVSTGGGSYKAVTHDAVIGQLREHLIKHGIVVSTSLIEGEFDKKEEGAKQRLYRATFRVAFINIDNPDDSHAVVVPAHAMDNGDKAPGKAVSYATKTALLKMFNIESGDDEESRYQDSTFDYAGILDQAEAAETANEARTWLAKARDEAIRTSDAGAAKAVGAVQKRLAEKFAASAKHSDDVAGQA